MVLPSVVIIQKYFKQKRPMANGLRIACQHVGGICSGPVLRLCINTYGLKGAMLLESGIVLHSVVCGAFFRDIYYKEQSIDTISAHSETKSHKTKSLDCSFLRVFNVSILRDIKLLLYLIGIFIQTFAVTVYFYHMIGFAYHINISKDRAALFMLMINVCMMTSAVAFGLIANLPQYSKMWHMVGVNLLVGVVVILTYWVNNFIKMTMTTCILGFLLGKQALKYL